jgi:CheY-like chemotaxis protein
MLIEKFAGDIWVDSVEGQGSQFHFFVFFKERSTTFSLLDTVDSSAEQLSEDLVELKSLRVLLAEDNPINQKVAVRHIEKLGWSVVTAVNGKEALEILEKEIFDVVLMDVNMPVLDGHEALRAIRNPDIVPDMTAGIPVIAMTAMTGKDEIRGLREEGFDGYIPKPFKSEVLKSVILSTIRKIGKEK